MNIAALLVIAVLGIAAIGATLYGEARSRRQSARLRDLQAQARHALLTDDEAQQHRTAVEMVREFESIAFKGVRSSGGYYLQQALLAALLAGCLALLAWGVTGLLTDYQIHNAAPCPQGAHHNCLLMVPGTVTGKDMAGHNNALYIATAHGTEYVSIFGDIHPVRIGDRVTLQQWNGTWVFVDSLHGRLETNDYPSRIMYGLGLGALLPPFCIFGIFLVRRQHRSYLALERALGEFEAQGSRRPEQVT